MLQGSYHKTRFVTNVLSITLYVCFCHFKCTCRWYEVSFPLWNNHWVGYHFYSHLICFFFFTFNFKKILRQFCNIKPLNGHTLVNQKLEQNQSMFIIFMSFLAINNQLLLFYHEFSAPYCLKKKSHFSKCFIACWGELPYWAGEEDILSIGDRKRSRGSLCCAMAHAISYWLNNVMGYQFSFSMVSGFADLDMKHRLHLTSSSWTPLDLGLPIVCLQV